MPTIAPWLTPPDYLSAIRSGAGIGLSLRQQDIAENEAADRLRQSYASLAANQAMEQKRLEAAKANQQAAMALRLQQADALNRYRQNELKVRQDAVDTAKQRLEDQEGKPDKPMYHFGTRGEVLKLDPSSGGVDVLREGDPLERPTPPGTVDYDESGNIKGAHGAPGSAAVKLIQDKAKTDKLIDALPKASSTYFGLRPSGNKLTKDQAKQFLDAAGGDKEKARELAKQDGWEF